MRKLRSIIFLFTCSILTLVSISFLFLILGIVVWKGFPAISLTFLTQSSRNFGLDGGIFYQMLGTILLILSAAMLSFPIALCSALCETEFLRPSLRKVAVYSIYVLNGVPTILYGLVGFMVFGIYLGWGISWITGSIILAIMILPTLVVSMREAILNIPDKYREAGLALGFSPWKLIQSVVIPQSFHGFITGLLLGLSRAAGETAAILFTATVFSGINFPRSFFEPVTTLQTHLFILSQEGVDSTSLTHAWGTALVLISLVLFFNLGSLFMRRKLSWEAER